MHVNKNYLSIKLFNNKNLTHGFFTRIGGYSKRHLKSLNCSLSNNDNKKIVIKNRFLALKKLQLEKKKLILLNQTHSSKVIRINKNNQHKKIIADGLITSLDNIVIGVLTADCAPIFIFDTNKKFICCLHSGWKGTLNNISKKSVKLFDKYNIERNNLIAIIGPCLATKNYEVEKAFEKKFIDKDSQYCKFFKYKNSTKSFFNLRGIINFQLKELGLKKVYNINKDTYANESLFFSHRRSTHKGEKYSGRLINLISLT
tara:strand:+ start:580 stop:1353 length:774 start_codon:yes stop_codon:yes gene_type:complete